MEETSDMATDVTARPTTDVESEHVSKSPSVTKDDQTETDIEDGSGTDSGESQHKKFKENDWDCADLGGSQRLLSFQVHFMQSQRSLDPFKSKKFKVIAFCSLQNGGELILWLQ